MRQRQILLFWLPLFASWLLMTTEGPVVSAAINRLPNEVIMLAAQGVVVSLAVTIESPIITMLSTATALTRDRSSFLLIRRFTLHWMVLLTAIHILLAFTPLFDLVVVEWIGTPESVARWVQPGLQIMIFWSAAIAWRRFLQGVLIRFGYTSRVAWGTVVRLISSGGTAIGLALWSDFPGVYIGAFALMAGVISEAAYATLAVRPLLAAELAPQEGSQAGADLTYRQLLFFHLPLAGTSLLTLLAQPLVTVSLARLAEPTRSLAAWPIIFQVLLIARAAAFALPEVVIALSDERSSYFPIRRFSLLLTGITLAGMLLFVLSPLLPFYVFTVQDTTQEVGELVQLGVTLFVLLPAITVLVSWLRGLLIKNYATKAVNAGMAINLFLTALLLLVGQWVKMAGIPAAALALNVALVGELIFLLWRTRRRLNFGLPNPLKLFAPAATMKHAD